MTSQTFHADAAELARAVRSVLPHASKDKGLAVLNSVHITAQNDRIVVEATDRYSLAEVTVEGTTMSEGVVDLILSSADATTLSRQLKDAYGNVAVTLTEGRVSFENTAFIVAFTIVAGTYPEISRLLNGWTESDSYDAAGVLWDADRLARFAWKNLEPRKTNRGAGIRVRFDKKALMLVEYGDHFRALVMPVRPYRDA